MTRETASSPTIATVLAAAVGLTLGCDAAPLGTDARDDSEAAGAHAPSGVVTQTADVFGQGMNGPVVAEDGATLRRTPNGISVQLSMPTPEPGAYTYPSGPPGGAWTDEEGHPEAFTLWAFVFNDPEACEHAHPDAPAGIECGSGDIGQPAGGAAFFVAGHLFGGPHLELSGHVSRNTDPFPTATPGVPLADPMGAEVHLAVAPHGALEPDLLPEQIQTPTQPGPDIWWLGLFE